ncbi:hypothetical protein EYR36_011862 [Pleurotus pulmonarius]|nr:hypothetical protein EYR36_011862 [Pleurotus pulmonarius]KAF4607254.1 hypothetical protein EYR38_001315 [Pleurotus pulmonarius]
MASSRNASRTTEDTYEGQNDQRLDDLHSKIRTLRGITTDIHDDVERQNLMLDDTGNSFSSFAGSLAQSSRRATQAFGLGEGGLRTWRVVMLVVGAFFAFWFGSKVYSWWIGSPQNV